MGVIAPDRLGNALGLFVIRPATPLDANGLIDLVVKRTLLVALFQLAARPRHSPPSVMIQPEPLGAMKAASRVPVTQRGNPPHSTNRQESSQWLKIQPPSSPVFRRTCAMT